jgi:Flp pilus assembly protein CpaB
MGVPTLSFWSTSRWPWIRGRTAVLIRRALAAMLFLTAGVLAVRPAAARDGPSGPAVVLARDVAAGSVLHPADVLVVPLPESLRPAGTLSTPESVDGRLLAGAARAGEPITDARLVEPSTGFPGMADPQRSIVPVRLADAGVAALLHPGARVDVVTTAGEGGRLVLASAAVVVTVVAPDADVGHGPSREDGPLVLLEVPSEGATQVAAMSLERPVTVTLR